MQMINTIIIDIETLDTTHSAVVLSIGAFAFDRFSLDETKAEIVNTESERKFHYKLGVVDQLFKCRTVSLESQQFWQKNNISQHFDGKGALVEQALIELDDFINDFVSKNKELKLYARGVGFDFMILENIFKQYGITYPIKFWQVRDIRSYIDALSQGNNGYLNDFKSTLNYLPHHALDDAMRDAELMCVAYKRNL